MTENDADPATLDKKVDVGFARVEGEFKRVDENFKRIDERFDDVGRRFDEVDRRLGEVARRFDKVDARLDSFEATMKTGFDRIDDRFAELHGLAIKLGGGLIGTLIVALATVVSTH